MSRVPMPRRSDLPTEPPPAFEVRQRGEYWMFSGMLLDHLMLLDDADGGKRRRATTNEFVEGWNVQFAEEGAK
jgi:hypothetical protein